VHRVQRQKIGNTVKEALLKKMNLYGEWMSIITHEAGV
jgi:hypothetical protein